MAQSEHPVLFEGETDEAFNKRLDQFFQSEVALTLSDALLAPIEGSEVRERFEVTDDKKAAWAIKRLRALRVTMEMNQSMADEEIAKVKEWVEDVNKNIAQDASYFIALLTRYALQQRRDLDRKSIKLPHGALKTRAGSVKWDINDEVFLAWAKVNAPDLIKVVETPKLAEAQKVFIVAVTDSVATDDSTGAIVDTSGVVV